ncbi:cytochrome C [Geotalea uraniireducens]|uniref:Cytochrome C n=1 Tax=Geotalea uraniireducens TaxID=351604 RepID=A0ABM8EPC7_9BACT|nr:CxxxxCH/CxxCH domain-containing protein [Geotalea uraniireducens]BDV44316.1 cytochrome C [Geotalea uraniireducens]
MKRFSLSAIQALMLALWATTAALAVDPPHDYGCMTCHNNLSDVSDLSNAAGIVNVCLSCHTPAITVKAFTPRDLANPFGSTALGVYTSGRKQTSHNWYAPVNVPAAGAAAPQLLSGPLSLNDTVNCGTCHDPHSNANGTFLRLANDKDQLCLDCHRARNTTDQTKGTHPVAVDYAAAVTARPAGFYATPRNANPANPTAAMKLGGGQVLCTTCHGVHFTDSNARTFDNASSATFGLLSSSAGYLLRTDLRGGTANEVNICTNCHAGKLAHNNKGQNIQCADCHAGHVDPGDGSRPNVWLVRRYMNYSAGIKLTSYRRPVFNQYTGAQSNFAGVYGVCQACHPVPPPGGSYPTEHASTDPNVCRGCHAHDSTTGSFSANCAGCHGFPPQQNSAGGPLGYATSSSYSYATSGVFKDESRTPHFAHAGKAPYAFGCSECHLGNRHATGNFQQVFIATTGILAASGGTVPTYNTAAPGTCANTYCHSNGAPVGGTTVYQSPTWANAKNSIIGTPNECSACHDASPPTNAHPGHLDNGFACAVCHAATVSGSTTIIAASKHVNGMKDVTFSGQGAIGGSGGYDAGGHQCANLYCHSNGKKGALIYVNPAAWNSGTTYGCNGCHGTSSPLGAPDYANGGAGTGTANSHYAHTIGAATTAVCANCHYLTADTVGGKLAANSLHLNGTINVNFNPAVAGANASYDPATGQCSNIACHGYGGAQWGSKAGCLACHSLSIGSRAAITPQFTGNSHHVQGISLSGEQCYQCHWEANADGSINHAYHHSGTPGAPVELVIYGAGSRPAAYVSGTTAVQYTANGSRTELAKINGHCLGCHSDRNSASQPFGDGKTPTAYAWDGTSVGAKYGDTGTTPWGKYSGTNVTPKSGLAKAYSAHGNAIANQGGWDLSETWTDRGTTANVLCFDCHNSHGSTVSGTTTSYASATTNGGILKDTLAGKGGYTLTYQPLAGGSTAAHNRYNPGAALCFDCHLNGTAASTPWGYTSTYGATKQIMGYLDSAYFGNGTFGNQLRYPYKATTPNMGGHFGASSPLTATPAHQIGGLCTPCHDPHGVSPTLGANKVYGVPLLKGTWVTSPYKEDVATADNQTYIGLGAMGEEAPRLSSAGKAAYQAAIATSYHIDQNTFSAASPGTMNATVNGVAQTDAQFGGLCLTCHGKQSLTDGTTHTWKDKNRIHESVKGWKTANSTIQHNYTCSKCHAPHNADLPRLMVSNCLDYRHRGRVANNPSPKISASYRGDEGSGSGSIPGSYTARNGGGDGWSSSSYSSSRTSFTCHENNDAGQAWNVKTPWYTSPGPAAPVPIAEPDATTVGASQITLQWNAATNPSGAALQYAVQVSASATFASIDYTSGWISGTSWTVTLGQGTWYWRVQARDAASTSLVSAWSAVDTFTLSATSSATAPSTPVLVNEGSNACSSSSGCAIALQWYAATIAGGGSSEYLVQVSSRSTFSSITASSGWISGTSWTATLGSGTWYWRVQARNAANPSLVSSWSAVDSFSVSQSSWSHH